MSTPNEYDGPGQAGSQPPPAGYGSNPDPNTPPPGYQTPGPQAPPPAGSMPPPGYQHHQAPPPGYQQPAPPRGDYRFETPKDAPRSMNAVMPVGGFSGIFKMEGLPQLLKISYIIWLVTAGLGIIFNLLGLLSSLVFLGLGSGSAVRGFVGSLIGLALMVAVVICAMKLKEGMQWARVALTAIVVLSVILLFIGASGTGLLGIAAAVLMWLPESTAWLNSRAKGVTY